MSENEDFDIEDIEPPNKIVCGSYKLKYIMHYFKAGIQVNDHLLKNVMMF